MNNKQSELPSSSSESTLSASQRETEETNNEAVMMAVHRAAVSPVLDNADTSHGQSRVCRPSTNSTQNFPARARAPNPVSHHVGAAGSAEEQSSSGANLPHGNASVGHGDASRTNDMCESAKEESEQKESPLKTKENDSSGKDEPKDMCIAEPKDQRGDEKESSPKVYEIPLTIMPSGGASEAREENNKSAEKKKASSKVYEIPLTLMPSEGASEESSKRVNRKKMTKPGQTSGRWTNEEHQAFLEGLQVFGREWKKVADRIPTRTSAQIRSHAQKYFAKLAREESLMSHEAPPPAAVAQQPAASLDDPQLPPSVQRNVERILANPTAVQREVEDTLRQLRERYRQLQIRLQESQRQGMEPMDRILEDRPSADGNVGMLHGARDAGYQRRKRSLEDSSIASGYQHDDASSTSDLSESFASLSPKRSLVDEELIALHVLGGTLRSSSSAELQPEGRSRASSLSEGEDQEAKRPRLSETSNDQEPNEEGEDGDEASI